MFRSSQPDDDDPLDRNVAWCGALQKFTNWTARDQMAYLAAGEKCSGQSCIQEQQTPDWLVRGRTVLIPKEGWVGGPDQFRPITCLNTSYKVLTGIITAILMKHMLEKDLLPKEKEALMKKRRGYLDALVIDKAAGLEAKTYRRDPSVSWIDYRKAFDMVPTGSSQVS